MSALENAKNMSVEDILAKTAASGLLEFGVECSVVTEKWNQVNAEREFQTNPDPDRAHQSQSKPRRCIPSHFNYGCTG